MSEFRLFRKFTAILILGLILTGCSLKAGKVHTFSMGQLVESPLPKAEVPQIILATPEEAEPLFKQASVSCADPKQCPQAVGFVLVNVEEKDHTGIMQCSGFLIDKDVLVTNSHCVPKS